PMWPTQLDGCSSNDRDAPHLTEDRPPRGRPARPGAGAAPYRRAMPELIAPTTRLHAAWIESRDEWGRGVHQDGAGMRPGDDYDSAAGFARWVRRLNDEEDTRIPPAQDWVHCTYRWIVDGDRVLG